MPEKLTSRVLSLILASLAGLSSLLQTGCSLPATELRSGTQKLMIPWVQDGNYSIQTVSVATLTNVSEVEGSSALFMMSPSIVDRRIVGLRPRARTFLDAQGVHVPTDQLSLHLLTLYAHMEKLRDLDTAVGLGQLLPLPRVVGVEVQIPQKRRNVLENNALYSPENDALLFVPYQGNDLPLTVNGGVIAHEHFHALFNYLVLKPTSKRLKSEDAGRVHPRQEKDMGEVFKDLPSSSSRKKLTPSFGNNAWELYHINLLRAMNEGMADLWGWVYSGDPIFVRRSLPNLRKSRDLDNPITQVMSFEKFRDQTVVHALSGNEVNDAYVLANQYAASLRGVFEPYLEKNKMRRQDLARQIVDALPLLTDRILKLEKDEWLQPAVLIEIFAEKLQGQERELCLPLMKLIPNLEDPDLQSRCQRLANLETAKEKS